MYTLLLVDDEEDVIEVIERKVSWEQIGFHVVGHAGNGFKALEMMEDMQPDVVMTDIRMWDRLLKRICSAILCRSSHLRTTMWQ